MNLIEAFQFFAALIYGIGIAAFLVGDLATANESDLSRKSWIALAIILAVLWPVLLVAWPLIARPYGRFIKRKADEQERKFWERIAK